MNKTPSIRKPPAHHAASDRARKFVDSALKAPNPPQTWNDWIDWVEQWAFKSRIPLVQVVNQRDLLAEVCAVLMERLSVNKTLGSIGLGASWTQHHGAASIPPAKKGWRPWLGMKLVRLKYWLIAKLEGE